MREDSEVVIIYPDMCVPSSFTICFINFELTWTPKYHLWLSGVSALAREIHENEVIDMELVGVCDIYIYIYIHVYIIYIYIYVYTYMV